MSRIRGALARVAVRTPGRGADGPSIGLPTVDGRRPSGWSGDVGGRNPTQPLTRERTLATVEVFPIPFSSSDIRSTRMCDETVGSGANACAPDADRGYAGPGPDRSRPHIRTPGAACRGDDRRVRLPGSRRPTTERTDPPGRRTTCKWIGVGTSADPLPRSTDMPWIPPRCDRFRGIPARCRRRMR